MDGLKAELQASLALSLDSRDDSSLVKQISIGTAITNELFERVSDDGRVALHSINYGYVEVRGKNEYLSHRYTIRLLIETISR